MWKKQYGMDRAVSMEALTISQEIMQKQWR